ncbi:class I SAM-dependent methyltransferase [Methanosphaerula subterraneus]|uniref:class I SAM-dependent methyltransferase n=1 Tax=Methanosphaerula subterraneus TaxID=3350244 RepID=UPI003F83D314
MTEIKTTIASTGPKGEYWGKISTQKGDDFIFPSPVNLPDWLEATAEWLGSGESILEIGPGKADLANKVLSEKRTTKRYIIADISEDILKHAGKRLGSLQNPAQVSYVHGDLNNPESLQEIQGDSLDRVILINVFGYLEPDIALKNISRVLHAGGLVRLTMGDHEWFSLSEDYDPETNRQYVRGRKYHDSSEIEPLGYTTSREGKKVPYYGYRRLYSKTQIEEILSRNGFVLEQYTTVVIPKDLFLKVRSTHQQDSDLSQKEEDLLDERGGRPIIDLIARKK